MRLDGRVAIVTGASRGLGTAIARALGRAGARVALCARRVQVLEAVGATLASEGIETLALPCDATCPGDPEAAVRKVELAWGRLDILVNNLGGAPVFGTFNELSDQDFRDAFELNVLSMVRFVRSALPLLSNSPVPRIINVSSISGIEPGLANPHYAITKAAVLNLSKHLANTLAREGILVNTLCPGPVHSEAWERNIARVAKQRCISPEDACDIVEREEAAKIPLGRVGDGDDVSSLAVFLASDHAAWITGACFKVDGGKSRCIL